MWYNFMYNNILDDRANEFSNEMWDAIDEKMNIPLWGYFNNETSEISIELNVLGEQVYREIKWLI